MAFHIPPFEKNGDPGIGGVRQWMDDLYGRFQPIEQARWIESNIDTLFYAGAQDFVNSYFNFGKGVTARQYYFNLIQQPVNMVTGYERQHRKGWMYQATEGGDDATTDQYTKIVTHIANSSSLHELKSKAKELSAISGMVLLQPFLDYTDRDQAQGDLKIKIWEYNSFIVDPYFRQPDMSDARFFWCQEYISQDEAICRFGEKAKDIQPLGLSPNTQSNFYFLPENQNLNKSDLLVVSYIWYRWRKKKKKLYSKKRNQFFEFGKHAKLDAILFSIPDMEIVEVEVPCWKLATVLNDRVMYSGEDQLGDIGSPVIPYFWNYDPHINFYDLRVRSLIRTMRDPQFLFNYKIIQNNDIAAATINAGWKRLSGAVANEENLKRAGQGYDVIINEGYQMSDCEKIVPSAVPQSDLALADQMMNLIYSTSGIQMENWSGQNDRQISSLTMLMKQAANLMVFQKYFDQWDYSDRLLGDKVLKIVLNNWNSQKTEIYLGEEPTPFFYSNIFSNYKVIVEESDLTPTQSNLQAQQMMDINAAFGREVFPPSMIIPKMNITGKGEIIPYLQQQEQAMQQMQQQQQIFAQSIEDAKLKELYSKATANIAMARERHGRAEADIGLFEERLSEITHNRSMATKAKMDALEKLMETVSKYGASSTMSGLAAIDDNKQEQVYEEDMEKVDAKHTALANKFLESIMGSMMSGGMSQEQTAEMQM